MREEDFEDARRFGKRCWVRGGEREVVPDRKHGCVRPDVDAVQPEEDVVGGEDEDVGVWSGD